MMARGKEYKVGLKAIFSQVAFKPVNFAGATDNKLTAWMLRPESKNV